MTVEITLIAITLFALAIATYTDLKSREVPDLVSYGLIFAALGIRSIFAIEGGWTILLSGLIGFAIAFGVACLFYYTNQWGGGDSKLLMGMGAVIGIPFPLIGESFRFFGFLMALLFIGAFYGFIFMIFIAARKQKDVTHAFKHKLTHYRSLHLGAWILALIFVLLAIPYHFVWPFIIVSPALFYLFLFISSVQVTGFTKYVSIHSLTEGDWLAEDVVVKRKTVMRTKTLAKQDLDELRNLAQLGKIKNVLIKEGIPFVPSFMVSYVLITFASPLLMKLAFGFLM